MVASTDPVLPGPMVVLQPFAFCLGAHAENWRLQLQVFVAEMRRTRAFPGPTLLTVELVWGEHVDEFWAPAKEQEPAKVTMASATQGNDFKDIEIPVSPKPNQFYHNPRGAYDARWAVIFMTIVQRNGCNHSGGQMNVVVARIRFQPS